ncbi:MAG: hypothetical protein COV10_04740 [Candidatus Vogelbacteria bacterium CG10_big_fil_rev_8_21_14_0_10_51_16]|uniref:DNA replication/recombination mediator RecO N-terminal domain-containing protein n=1 Tax=Candidatus Vogelbacteria bacterium CG10_big_fil_rev_8_21_14_0_10_51_16 TaxID=1975045 RepID=A0A2H0RD63_9BACT|nr:MAG: hypothetical protein COV10_04740 [Candidatus Vogelbacteria bacterium CG10_big_fil_rev_8_21_14_0_10_51_16]
MYRIYTTRGFVVSGRPYGEASATLTLLTEDLGVVRARAQAVRGLASKLRYGLQSLSRGAFSLVRGREVWRLTSVSPCDQASQNYTTDFPKQRGLTPFSSFATRALFARVLALVERLVHGEEEDRRLFALVEECHELLQEEGLSSVELRCLELLITARILDHLGYIAPAPSIPAVRALKVTKKVLSSVGGHERDLARVIEVALQASQL